MSRAGSIPDIIVMHEAQSAVLHVAAMKRAWTLALHELLHNLM